MERRKVSLNTPNLVMYLLRIKTNGMYKEKIKNMTRIGDKRNLLKVRHHGLGGVPTFKPVSFRFS